VPASTVGVIVELKPQVLIVTLPVVDGVLFGFR
jgi:hypothetical protein